MSNTRKLRLPEMEELAADFRTADTWQLRIRVSQPWDINDVIEAPSLRLILERGKQLLRNTSYMVVGPNRTVLWSLERWHPGKHTWIAQKQGTYTMKAGERL